MPEQPIPSIEADRFWAIPLSNSERREWSDSKEYSTVTYDWNDIGVHGNTSKNNFFQFRG